MAKPLFGGIVMLGLDDTLTRKRGLKIFGTGMHHDRPSSTRSLAFLCWGHSWVVLGLIVELPLRPDHHTILRLLFRLYLNRRSAAKHRRPYPTKPQFAVEMLTSLCCTVKIERFHVVSDSAYGGQSVFCHLPENCDLTSRMLFTARLYDATPPRREGTNDFQSGWKFGRWPSEGGAENLPRSSKTLSLWVSAHHRHPLAAVAGVA